MSHSGDGTDLATVRSVPSLNRLLLALLPVVALVSAPTSASADDDYYGEEARPPPPAPGPQPVYTAPLSQTTQTTYVPQSVAMSGPEEISSDTDRAAPAGYTAVLRPRKGLLIGGGVSFGASYGLSILIAAIGSDIGGSNGNEAASMWIPVAGPFLQIANTDSATLGLFLAGIGAVQTTGAIMLYYGLTTKKRVFVRNDLVGSLQVTPYTADGTTGMLLSGRF